jgi:hypothetical protein
MAKPKRMSEMFTSSSEKVSNTATATATPPYSSEGPTLPVIGATDTSNKASKKRKSHDENLDTVTKKPLQPLAPPTFHPSLYKPWTRLPCELLKLLEAQTRLRATHNIVPVVFSKNQNVKSGINRLKTYLGAHRDPASTIEMPDALKENDLAIAVSAQGEGTTKLVGIVDMVRRLAAPTGKGKDENAKVEIWWMYTQLTSVEIERKVDAVGEGAQGGENVKKSQTTQEEEAFERMDVNEPEAQKKESIEHRTQMIRAPVLTIWLTREKIPAFKSVFGEQTFSVQRIPEEED